MPSNVFRIVIAGDTNMRKTEDEQVENLRLQDAWKTMVWKKWHGYKQYEYTWDSHDNLYHKNGYKFRCRFDRMYLRDVECD